MLKAGNFKHIASDKSAYFFSQYLKNNFLAEETKL